LLCNVKDPNQKKLLEPTAMRNYAAAISICVYGNATYMPVKIDTTMTVDFYRHQTK
jgi:hypothetical protein